MVRRSEGASRLRVALSCTVCGSRNYKRSRPRRDAQQVLELKKYCKTCAAHTLHVESH